MFRRYWFVLLLLPLQVSCAHQDPFQRPYTWNASADDNDANLRAMIVNPADLQQGRGTDTSLAAAAAAPVKRLLSGHRYPLPQSDVLDVQLTGQSSPQGQGGNTGGQ